MKKSKQVVELSNKIYDLQKDILKKKLQFHELEMKGKDTSDLKIEISELNNKITMLMAKCELILEKPEFIETNPMKQNPLIFIVDADKPFNRFVDIYLKRNNYTNINCYYSGEECVENLNLNPDIIVLDYDFSATPSASMNGLQVLRKINEVNPDVKVIMMSDSMHTDVKRIIEAKYVHSITKYILKGTSDIITLKETINNISERNAYSQVCV